MRYHFQLFCLFCPFFPIAMNVNHFPVQRLLRYRFIMQTLGRIYRRAKSAFLPNFVEVRDQRIIATSCATLQLCNSCQIAAFEVGRSALKECAGSLHCFRVPSDVFRQETATAGCILTFCFPSDSQSRERREATTQAEGLHVHSTAARKLKTKNGLVTVFSKDFVFSAHGVEVNITLHASEKFVW